MILNVIINILISILFFILAYFVGVKGKINLIHFYHWKNVKDEDKIPYTKEFGKGLNIIGIGLVVTSIFEYFSKSEWMWVIYVACFCYAFLIFHRAQMKYNNRKWFS